MTSAAGSFLNETPSQTYPSCHSHAVSDVYPGLTRGFTGSVTKTDRSGFEKTRDQPFMVTTGVVRRTDPPEKR